MPVKQVIIMRKDLNMRKGKMIAQGGHAVLGCFIGLDVKPNLAEELAKPFETPDLAQVQEDAKNMRTWLETGMTKICLGIEGLNELNFIMNAAKAAGLRCYSVTDAGHTEVDPGTVTCCAIGPNDSDAIDQITGGLALL